MKIVIDIPDEEYKLDKLVAESGMGNTAILRILGGTPLPKGHGALKDADAIAIQTAMLRDNCNYYGNEYESACFQCYDRAVDEILDAPTIIEADEEGTEE